MKTSALKIFIDGDSCPKAVKEVVFKAAMRTSTLVVVVANSHQNIPNNPLFSFQLVEKHLDAADDWIVDQTEKGHLIIAEDVPFAANAVEKGAIVITPRGRRFDQANISESLATRNLMHELRSGGMIQSGQGAYSAKDKTSFINMFDKELTKAIRIFSMITNSNEG